MEYGDLLYLSVNVSTILCFSQSPYSLSLQSSPSLWELGTIMTNNSALAVSDIGEGASALTCHTELTTCCREQDNPSGGALGEWIGPDSNQISTNSTDRFYVTRQQSSISLNRGGSSTVEGLYCCVIPRTGGEMTFCVQMSIGKLIYIYCQSVVYLLGVIMI